MRVLEWLTLLVVNDRCMTSSSRSSGPTPSSRSSLPSFLSSTSLRLSPSSVLFLRPLLRRRDGKAIEDKELISSFALLRTLVLSLRRCEIRTRYAFLHSLPRAEDCWLTLLVVSCSRFSSTDSCLTTSRSFSVYSTPLELPRCVLLLRLPHRPMLIERSSLTPGRRQLLAPLPTTHGMLHLVPQCGRHAGPARVAPVRQQCPGRPERGRPFQEEGPARRGRPPQ